MKLDKPNVLPAHFAPSVTAIAGIEKEGKRNLEGAGHLISVELQLNRGLN